MSPSLFFTRVNSSPCSLTVMVLTGSSTVLSSAPLDLSSSEMEGSLDTSEEDALSLGGMSNRAVRIPPRATTATHARISVRVRLLMDLPLLIDASF